MFNQNQRNMTTLEVNLPALDQILSRLEVIESKVESIQKKKSITEEWISNPEAAEMLRVTPRTLQNYRDNGILPFSQVGSKIYYKVSDLKKHLDSHYVGVKKARRV